MSHRVEIIKTIGGWCARFDKTIVKSLTRPDKNEVVTKAIALAQRVYGRAVLIIHGMDGRVLEERHVENIDSGPLQRP